VRNGKPSRYNRRMRLIAPSEYRRMPWKNGGGTTLEIAIHPPDAAWAGFDWRMSIAEIESDGPFSTFPGIDRTLVVLAGRGMRLTGIRDEPVDVRPYDLVTFAGEAQVESRLLDGPTRDLNVMTRRPVHADVRVVQRERIAWAGAAAYVCHAASRSCACVVGDATVEVREAHTLVCDAPAFAVDASDGGVAVVARVVA
jgi:uncharacterized protein